MKRLLTLFFAVAALGAASAQAQDKPNILVIWGG